jgi:hypothetical protein
MWMESFWGIIALAYRGWTTIGFGALNNCRRKRSICRKLWPLST